MFVCLLSPLVLHVLVPLGLAVGYVPVVTLPQLQGLLSFFFFHTVLLKVLGKVMEPRNHVATF